MFRPAVALPLIAALLMVVSCDDIGTPTGITGSQAPLAQAPNITGFDASPDGSGSIRLQVAAQDPSGSPLTFSWKVSQGELSSPTGQSTVWRPPTAAGTYTATVEVKNNKGLSRSVSQQVQVSASGVATVQGQANVSAPVSDNPTSGTGQFQIPGQQPSVAPSLLIVGGNPSAPPAPLPTPSPPFQQPVATPVPGASNPTPPGPGQPIATPTPTVPPGTPTPVPTAPPIVPTTPPGVPEPPPSIWKLISPGSVGSTQPLNAVHFVPGANGQFQTGWVAGLGGTVLRSTNSGQSFSFAGIGVAKTLTSVAFTSDVAGGGGAGGFSQAGFVAGNEAVFRSTDLGETWSDITPPNSFERFIMVLPYNAQIVIVAGSDGRMLRSANVNAGNPANVSWEAIQTKPAARPGDQVKNLEAGAIFPTDTSLGFFVGDGIYRLDHDHPNPASRWKRLHLFATEEGVGTSVEMTSVNDIWVSTSTGRLFHSTNGGDTWTQIKTFVNRESNGNDLNLSIGSIADISFISPQIGYMTNGNKVYDTQDGGATWKQTVTPSQSGLAAIQVEAVGTTHIGWGVGFNGEVLRFVPNTP